MTQAIGVAFIVMRSGGRRVCLKRTCGWARSSPCAACTYGLSTVCVCELS